MRYQCAQAFLASPSPERPHIPNDGSHDPERRNVDQTPLKTSLGVCCGGLQSDRNEGAPPTFNLWAFVKSARDDQLQPSFLTCFKRGLDAVVNIKFPEDLLRVRLDGVRAEVNLVGDLTIR